MYKAYVTYVTNIRPAANADRLNACEVFGNTTIIEPKEAKIRSALKAGLFF